MIARSRRVAVVAMVAAAALHGGAALGLMTQETAQIEGGGVQETRLGTSFADLAQGVLTSETPDEIEPVEDTPETPVETPVEPHEEVAEVDPIDPAPQPVPEQPDTPSDPILTAPELADGLIPLVPETIEPVEAPLPETLAALTPRATPTAPAETAPVSPVQPDEVIEVLDPETTVPQLSKRPVRRDPTLEQPEPKPVKRAATTPPKPKPRGNSNANANQGTTRGTEQAQANRQGAGQASRKQAGNAASSNYPGLVNRHLSRVRKPSLSRRGVVTVRFSIASSGGLSSVAVAKSSGASKLDQAAVQMIRRAAPFPRPPAGAQSTFVVPVTFN